MSEHHWQPKLRFARRKTTPREWTFVRKSEMEDRGANLIRTKISPLAEMVISPSSKLLLCPSDSDQSMSMLVSSSPVPVVINASQLQPTNEDIEHSGSEDEEMEDIENQSGPTDGESRLVDSDPGNTSERVVDTRGQELNTSGLKDEDEGNGGTEEGDEVTEERNVSIVEDQEGNVSIVEDQEGNVSIVEDQKFEAEVQDTTPVSKVPEKQTTGENRSRIRRAHNKTSDSVFLSPSSVRVTRSKTGQSPTTNQSMQWQSASFMNQNSTRQSPSTRSTQQSPSTRSTQQTPSTRSTQQSPSTRSTQQTPSTRSTQQSPSTRSKQKTLSQTRQDLSPSHTGQNKSSVRTRTNNSVEESSSSNSVLQDQLQQNISISKARQTKRTQATSSSTQSNSRQNVSSSKARQTQHTQAKNSTTKSSRRRKQEVTPTLISNKSRRTDDEEWEPTPGEQSVTMWCGALCKDRKKKDVLDLDIVLDTMLETVAAAQAKAKSSSEKRATGYLYQQLKQEVTDTITNIEKVKSLKFKIRKRTGNVTVLQKELLHLQKKKSELTNEITDLKSLRDVNNNKEAISDWLTDMQSLQLRYKMAFPELPQSEKLVTVGKIPASWNREFS